MNYPKRKRSRWTEGGRTFERIGMVVREVVPCGCGKFHLAGLGACGPTLVKINRKDKEESK